MKGKIWLMVGIVFVFFIGGAVGGVSLWRYHEEPRFCATCHLMEPYLASWESSDYLANSHSKAGVTCLKCHEPDISQQMSEGIAYITGDYTETLDERTFPDEFCLRCHMDEMAMDLTANAVPMADTNCGTCHNVHRVSVFTCSECHTDLVDIPEGWK